MRDMGYDSMGAMVEYDIIPTKKEYLVVIDRSGDVILRKMELNDLEMRLVENRIDVYAVISMSKLSQLRTISMADLGEEEDV